MNPKFSVGDEVEYTRNADGLVVRGTVQKVFVKSDCKTRSELWLFYNPQLLGHDIAYKLNLHEGYVKWHPVTIVESRLRLVQGG